MFNIGDKVKSDLGATGVVEGVERGKDGQLLIMVRWKTGVLGAYSGEEVRRYGFVKAQ